ncbi:MAG: hypothetical protein BHW06_04390 [Clostridium sp. 44_14]|nr:MAG: hypothetical protein BHW06_04390 [Clostridium sp. 44_14]
MLTPIDIQNHVLKSTMGGYNKKETDDFIESIQASYEQLYKENSDLKKKITTLSEGIQYYKQMEGTLQKTLVLAEQTASETLETSKTAAAQVEKESRAKAEVMLREAKSRADGLVADAQEKANKLTRESEERAATLKKESEETAAALKKESEEKAETLTRESERKAETVTREAEEKAETVTREAEEKARKVTREAEEKADRLERDSQRKADDLVAEAEKKADNIMYNAKERADRIMADTKASADKVISDTREKTEEKLAESGKQLSELTDIVRKLMGSYDNYKQQFKDMLNMQLEQLDKEEEKLNTTGLEDLLESQQVKMVEEQAAAKQSVDDMEEHTKELDLPVEDTAPEREDVQEENDILAGGLSAEVSEEPVEEKAEKLSLDIDTPATEDIATGIHVSAEEAVAYTAPETVEEEKEEAPVEDDIKSKLDEIDSIASEALNEMKKESSEDPFNSINSMLGTSYDDFVPANKDNTEAAEENPVVEQAAVSSETPVTVAADNDTKAEESAEKPAEQKEIPPTTTDELPTVQETYDAETYVTNETYFGSADNMTYSIPDPVPAATEEPAQIKAEPVEDTAEAVPAAETVHEIPMPDFSKLDAVDSAVSEEQPVIPHAVPMPDFSKLDVKKDEEPDVSADLDAIAAEAMAALDAEKKNTTDEIPTVQESYDAETYVTNETYFGSADNMTYSIPDPVPAEEEKVVEDEFASGISGVDPTANGAIPPAPGELFTAPSEFDNVPAADDEFAVTKPEDPTAEAKPEEKTVNPFTMINAEE